MFFQKNPPKNTFLGLVFFWLTFSDTFLLSEINIKFFIFLCTPMPDIFIKKISLLEGNFLRTFWKENTIPSIQRLGIRKKSIKYFSLRIPLQIQRRKNEFDCEKRSKSMYSNVPFDSIHLHLLLEHVRVYHRSQTGRPTTFPGVTEVLQMIQVFSCFCKSQLPILQYIYSKVSNLLQPLVICDLLLSIYLHTYNYIYIHREIGNGAIHRKHFLFHLHFFP
jgi:hypothetical protein